MDDMNKALEGLITGIGAIAEMTKISYDAFLKAGFNEEDALYLAGVFMESTLDRSAQK